MPAAEAAAADFEKLTRRHAIKLHPAVQCSVEEAGLAVGEVVGFDSVKSASRMNGAIVMFLDSTAKVGEVVEKGVIIQDTFTPVSPLVNPATKITISNAPPFIKNEVLAKELSRYGQIVSQIKMVSLGCKSPKLKHVVCHRRQVYMILKNKNDDLNLSFSFKVDGFNYVVFVSSETMKCFGCGAEGHLIRSCPEKGGAQQAGAAASGGDPSVAAAAASGGDPSVAAAAASGGDPSVAAAASGGDPSVAAAAASGGDPSVAAAASGGDPSVAAAASGGDPSVAAAASGGDPSVAAAASGGDPSVAAAASGGDPSVAAAASGGDPSVAAAASGGDPSVAAAAAAVSVAQVAAVKRVVPERGAPSAVKRVVPERGAPSAVKRVVPERGAPSAAGDPPAAPVPLVEGAPGVCEPMVLTTAEESVSVLSEDMEDFSDEDLIKLCQKRKLTDSVKTRNKSKRQGLKLSMESESDFSLTQEDSLSLYPPTDIKRFLEQTKGARQLSVRDFFPDLRQFVKSARFLTRKNSMEGILTDQEVFRLRKLAAKVNAQIIIDEDDF